MGIKSRACIDDKNNNQLINKKADMFILENVAKLTKFSMTLPLP